MQVVVSYIILVVEHFSRIYGVAAVVFTVSLFFSTTPQVSHAQSVTIDPPTNVTATAQSFKNIDITYSAATGAAGYVVHENGKGIATTTQLSYRYPYVTFPGKQYCLSVVAYSSDGVYSAPSPESCVSIARGTAIAPVDFVAEKLSANSVKLSWRVPLTQEQLDAADPIDGYVATFFIERSTDGSTWGFVSQLEMPSTSLGDLAKTHTDSNAKPGLNNTYRLTSFTQTEGFSVSSPTVTISLGEELAVPAIPSGAAISYTTVASTDAATLSWVDTSTNETGFIIEKKNGDSWTEWKRADYPGATSLNLSGLSPASEYIVRVRAVNSAGMSGPSNEVTITTPSALNWSPPVPSQHLLVVFNADNPESVSMKNYYMTNRPGISDANVLALNFNPTQLNSCHFDNQSIDNDKFIASIRDPIAQWLQTHPEKPIRYIVLMYGIPSITVISCNNYSVSYEISRSLQKLGVRDGIEFRAPRSTRFTPEYYRGTTALVMHLDMGSVEATKGYIDKLKKVYDQMSDKNVVISAKNAGLGGTKYYFDDRMPSLPYIGKEARDGVLSVNPSADVMYRESGYYSTASDVLGYSTWATHAGLAKNFPTNGSVIFSGNSGWYVLRTGESWNGIYNNISTGQSNPPVWFAKTAFGGTNYENTPVGAVGQVREPGGGGLASKELFTQWERGYLFAEAAWASRNIDVFIAIGDPLVANTGAAPAITPRDTVVPKIISSYPIGVIPPDTTEVRLSVTTDEVATCAYSMNANKALTSSGSLPFTTTGNTVHTSPIPGLIASSTYKYYVRCRDAAGNTMGSDHLIEFTVARPTPGPDLMAPTVVLTYPTNNLVVTSGTVTLRVSASDNTSVASVSFYVDGTRVGDDTTSPYTKETTLGVGTHTAYARARDAAGNDTTSATVRFTIQAPVVVETPIIPVPEQIPRQNQLPNQVPDQTRPGQSVDDRWGATEYVTPPEEVGEEKQRSEEEEYDGSLFGSKAVRLTFVSWALSGVYSVVQGVIDFFVKIF